MKKILSVILALAVVLSAFGSLLIASADTTGLDFVYIADGGTGDGTTAETPTDYDTGVNAVKDGGIVYVVGTVNHAHPTVNSSLLGIKEKTISYIGANDDAALHTSTFFEICGNVIIDNVNIVVDGSHVYSFKLQEDTASTLTFGKDTTFAITKTGNDGVIAIIDETGKSTSRVTFDGCAFPNNVFIGGYGAWNANVVSTAVVLKNGATAPTIAVSRAHDATTDRLKHTGDYLFEVSDSTVNQIILGHNATFQRQRTQGFAKAVVSGNSTVGTIYLGAYDKEINSNGYRVAEINGGTVSNILDSTANSNTSCSYKQIVILNNGTSVANIAAVDTLITAPEGVFVSAIGTRSTLSGYTITAPEGKYILLDGNYANPNSATGYYDIPEGTHAVTVTDEAPLDLDAVYISEGGTGTGLSSASPTTYANALNMVKNGGTIYVVGEVALSTIGTTEKALNIAGADSSAVLSADSRFNLIGTLNFTNIAFQTASVSDYLFLASQSDINDITFGEGTVIPTASSNYYFSFNYEAGSAVSTNKLTIDNAGEYNNIYSGGYNNGGWVKATTEVIVNNENAIIDNIAVAHGWNANGKFGGNHRYTINAGTIGNVILGHTFGQGRTSIGTRYAVINGGTVGAVYTGPLNSELNGTGVRVAEINGGNVSAVRNRGGSQGTTTTKTVVILNNGMADKIDEIATSFNTLIKAYGNGKVSAIVRDDWVNGYQITTTADMAVLLDDTVVMVGEESGIISIPEGEHIIDFVDASSYAETYEGNVRRTTWVERAEALLADTSKSFTAGKVALGAALFNLKTADAEADDTDLIAALRAAWNNVEYDIGEQHYDVTLAAYGDTTGDGNINIMDIVRAKRYMASGTEMAEFAFDMDDNNAYDGNDLVALRKLILAK